jgi:hypothetical protein
MAMGRRSWRIITADRFATCAMSIVTMAMGMIGTTTGTGIIATIITVTDPAVFTRRAPVAYFGR